MRDGDQWSRAEFLMSLVLGFVVLLLGPAFGESGGSRSSNELPSPIVGPATAPIERLASDKALKGLDLGASVRCTTDGVLWGGHRGNTRMNPASGAKLLSTASALDLLGPEHTVATHLHGRLLDGVAQDVVLVAGADPSLTQADIERLAKLTAAAGVTRIDGGITIDISYFSGSSTPPAFATKKTDAGYRPEVPAFAIGSGVFIATVSPAKKPGDPVRVTTSLVAASLEIDNSATTVPGKALDKLVVEARAGANGKTRLVVSGTLGKDAPAQGVKKRLADPARIAAELFVRALAKEGVVLDGALRIATTARPANEPLAAELARITSDPLAADVKETNTTSNNFMAETIFKHLGADGSPTSPTGPATWERAVERTTAALKGLGVAPEGFQIINGSGLYDGTKVSPEAMTRLLTAETAETPPALSFRDSLAVAGVIGTLKGRLIKLKGKVQGKTGTLDNAVSLSGYVPSKRCLLAFSVLVNGDIGARAVGVNRRIDAFVLELARL